MYQLSFSMHEICTWNHAMRDFVETNEDDLLFAAAISYSYEFSIIVSSTYTVISLKTIFHLSKWRLVDDETQKEGPLAVSQMLRYEL